MAGAAAPVAVAAEAQPAAIIVRAQPVAVVRANRCADDRYPALAGAWLVGCVRDDRVNVAESMDDGRVVTLTGPVLSPGLGAGWLWSPGRAVGAWVLPDWSRGDLGARSPPRVPWEGVSPPALVHRAGATETWRAVVAYADHVDLIDLGADSWPRFDARPLPGEPVAGGVGWAAWTERDVSGSAGTGSGSDGGGTGSGAGTGSAGAGNGSDGGGGGSDVWMVRTAEAETWIIDGKPVPDGVPTRLAAGPGDQHGVVGQGSSVWWVDGDEVVQHRIATGEERRLPAWTGFAAGLTVSADGEVACWEDRRAIDLPAGIDVRCSDGTVVDRPGDQRWPSLGGGWLVFREGEQVLKVAFPGG